ncbi:MULTISPECIES: cell envelope integrity protein CreD [unclassified Spirosoma]|uniref:cell envelope integrity protein CreD n=1 Tax=unclassified Spirosoma TaxID=2621999 RepID=UPI00095AFEC8|nr:MULTISPECIES: cell envelope integrity protein CreD [unclassified Spirosoma]MBN8826945.1 cell envelope integrity protein CreD [Spirosoma sp.]OJW70690.1 MAG: cell envelope integrity protein CreD [Spirosoma sp. 48-14]
MEPLSTTDQPVSLFDRINHWIRTSTMLKIAVIGVLILVLLIPTEMLQALIRERESTRNEALAEVSAKWGGEQVLGGPVLSVPYEEITKDDKGNEQRQTFFAHFLPDDLHINGKVQPEQRNRGIFVVMLYNTRLTIRGRFHKPSAASLGISPAALQWDKAFLSLGISDMKGIKDAITFRVNSQPISAESGIPSNDLLPSGVSASVPINAATETLQFESVINLNGSTQLSFLPFGKETRVTLQSPWSTPSFTGSFLPDQRSIHDKGFQASWKVLQFNRNFPQQGIGNFLAKSITGNEEIPSFGVKLLLPVDEYQKTMRSAKYGILFVILTFVSFFFVEILDRRRIHPIQYLLVGFAVCLFYLLLLSISEHLSFDGAYLIGSAIILALITFYVRYVFQNLRLTALFSVILALLYGFFYSLLQLEDYSLLLGSFGLLLILGVIMYLTRNVNWYKVYEAEGLTP